MAEFSFIHSSDLHLGKKFKSFPDEDNNTRSKLRIARTNIIKNLMAVAEKNKVSHILLAGDTFDTETPADQIIKQTIDKMKENSSIHWWVISGNHDSLEAEILWGLLVLFLACILCGGIYLNFYVNDEIDDYPKKDTLLITSYIIIGLSGLALFVILLPYIIQYVVFVLTFMGIQEILD